ncbi:MAG TPA: hypothetical protein DEP45_06950 [Armatimonadetes bacterium]|nr:hypothetical protein [Armatimonadota bacterium]
MRRESLLSTPKTHMLAGNFGRSTTVFVTTVVNMQRSNLATLPLSGLLMLLFALPGVTQQVAWHSDLATAMADAKQNGCPILAFFHSVGCGPCAQMEQETLADPQITALIAGRFEAVSINGITQADLAMRYLISYYPTVKFIDASGVSVYDCYGYIPPVDFLAVMNEGLAAHQALIRARSAAAQPEVSAEGALSIARDYLQASQFTEAAHWARRELDAAPNAETQYLLGVALVEAGEPAQAEEPLLAALTATEDAPWLTHARLKLGYAWLQMGKDAAGIDLLKAVHAAADATPKIKAEAARLLRWWGVDAG